MSSHTYPRIGATNKIRVDHKHPLRGPDCKPCLVFNRKDESRQRIKATRRLAIESNYFRGEDVVIAVCEECKGLPIDRLISLAVAG